MKVYIVEMQRWGDTETHHYIVGAYYEKAKAEDAGEKEAQWRGGKYEPNIVEVEIDRPKREYPDDECDGNTCRGL